MVYKTISLRELSKQYSDNLLDIWHKKLRDKLIKLFRDNSINVLDIGNWRWLSDGSAVIDDCVVIGYDEDGNKLFSYAYCSKCFDERSTEETNSDDDIEYFMNSIYEHYEWIIDAHMKNVHGIVNEHDKTTSIPIKDLGLSTRVFLSLSHAGIKYVHELTAKIQQESGDLTILQSIRNIGEKSQEEIVKKLKQRGYL